MAASQILATGVGTADSGDIDITTTSIVAVKGDATMSADFVVALKDDAGAYQPIGRITGSNKSMILHGPGTYRFSRTINSGSAGLFKG